MSSKSASGRSSTRRDRSLAKTQPGLLLGISRGRTALTVAAVAGVAVLVVAAAVLWLGQKRDVTAEISAAPGVGITVQGTGGTWTNVTPDQLATLLDESPRAFTLLNVKTPYSGEIEGTDLYIPYDQLAARASELPADRSATIAVYCRSGHESAIAAQTLLDLSYRSILNLDGGMTAWTASGRQLVQKART